MNVIEKKLTEIKPYEHNPRINKDAINAVKNSIKQFGFKVPLVIDKDGVIVTGHTRYEAAKQLGMKTVPCVISDDISDEDNKAFRIADNKIQEKSEWNVRLLSEELQEIALDYDVKEFGFENQELKLLIGEDEEEEEKPPRAVCKPKKRVIIIFGKEQEREVKLLLGEEGSIRQSYDIANIIKEKGN